MCAVENLVNVGGWHGDKNLKREQCLGVWGLGFLFFFFFYFLPMRRNISRKFRSKSAGHLETCRQNKIIEGETSGKSINEK